MQKGKVQGRTAQVIIQNMHIVTLLHRGMTPSSARYIFPAYHHNGSPGESMQDTKTSAWKELYVSEHCEQISVPASRKNSALVGNGNAEPSCRSNILKIHLEGSGKLTSGDKTQISPCRSSRIMILGIMYRCGQLSITCLQTEIGQKKNIAVFGLTSLMENTLLYMVRLESQLLLCCLKLCLIITCCHDVIVIEGQTEISMIITEGNSYSLTVSH